MKIIEKTSGNYNFKFVCDSRNTRYGFAHDCTLFINNIEDIKASCFYLNRTWECYQYQSVCKTAIDKEIEQTTEHITRVYKREHDLSRVSAKARAEIEKICAENEFLTACREARAQL